jgi:iron complex outermembrane receptor protein
LSIAVSAALCSIIICQDAHARDDKKNLDDVTISSSPYRETLQNQIAPTLLLQRNELQSKMDANLGTLLEQESGITTSGHGPNSGRPVIRGLSNDRVKILSNGSSIFDVSNSSEDHAVAVNPIFADRIEVLRGSATLRYGGNAIGGAVNVIDDRTPVNVGIGQHGEARFSGRLGSAQDTAAAHYAVGRENFALSVDAFDIRTGDVKVPGEFFSAAGLQRFRDESGDPAASNRTGKLPNSSAKTDGGSVGGAIRGAWGYAGISVQQLNNIYGIGNAASDEQPRIDLKQDRTEMKGRLNLQGFFQSVDLDAVNSRYRHSELVDEGNGIVPEVTFLNKGDEVRLEGLTRAFGATRGTVGFQRSNSRLAAFNDEGLNTFLPNSRTSGDALYATALTQTGRIALNAGLRHENHRVQGDSRTECGDISAADRRFNLNSASVGARLPLDAANSVSVQFNHSERAPTAVELFACGRHEATFNAQYGNVNLPKEKANGIDLSWAFKNAQWNNRAAVYQQDFSNFISLRADPGATPDPMNPDGPRALQAGLPAFDYSGTKATLRGFELAAVRTFAGSNLGLTNAYTPQLEAKFDHTRGTDDNTGKPLPRITPERLTLAAALTHAKGYARLQVVRHSAQNRISAEDETPTDGYTRIDAFAAYRPTWNVGATRSEFFLQGRNLTDTRGRNHVSFLKDFIPVQGRTVTAGVRFLF